VSQNLHALALKLEAIGVTPPAPMVNAVSVWQAVNEVSTDDVLADLQASVENCAIDKKNAVKAVKAAAVALAQRDWGTQVAQNLAGSFVRAEKLVIQYNADEIVNRMRTPFDEAVATIADTLPTLGANPQNVDLNQAGPAVATAKDRWTNAVQDLSKIENVLARMVPLGYGRAGQRVTWYLAAAFDLDAIDTAEQVYLSGGNGFTNLIHAGYQLHLNTADEAAALATKAQQVAEEAAQADAEAARIAAETEAAILKDAWVRGDILPPQRTPA